MTTSEPLTGRICPDCSTAPARDQRAGNRDGRCHPCWATATQQPLHRDQPTPTRLTARTRRELAQIQATRGYALASGKAWRTNDRGYFERVTQ